MYFRAILCNFCIEAVLMALIHYSGTYPWNIKLYGGQDLSITETGFTGGAFGVTIVMFHLVLHYRVDDLNLEAV